MNNFNKLKLLVVAFMLPAFGFCQDQASKESSTYFSNALFLTLLVIIIVLAIVIIAFSSAFKNIADSDFLTTKYGNKKEDGGSKIGNITSIILLLSSISMIAQEKVAVVAVKDDGLIGGLDQFTFYFMLFIVFIELLVMSIMFYQFNYLVKAKVNTGALKSKKVESKILMTLTDAIPLEDEDSILLDHDYDGIKELDNNLPPWWKYGFYLTIIVAVVYLINYHVIGTGDLQGKEYEKEMAKAKLEVDEFMKTSASNIDENSVKMLTEASDIAAGKDIYMVSCTACHGKFGEGSVGPNLTDDYWLHGGSVQDIFKTIKYGWVEKGMKSWKDDFSPLQMAQLTSFIKSLKGNNPANAKPKQGDLYMEGSGTVVGDTSKVIVDTLSTPIK